MLSYKQGFRDISVLESSLTLVVVQGYSHEGDMSVFTLPNFVTIFTRPQSSISIILPGSMSDFLIRVYHSVLFSFCLLNHVIVVFCLGFRGLFALFRFFSSWSFFFLLQLLLFLKIFLHQWFSPFLLLIPVPSFQQFLCVVLFEYCLIRRHINLSMM